jgi:hypothetical protein
MKETSWIKSLLKLVMISVFVVSVVIGYILYSTYCMYTLYDWFLIPVGMPTIPFWNMYGISLFLSLLLPVSYTVPKHIDDKKTIWMICSTPLIILIIGYIVHTFLI